MSANQSSETGFSHVDGKISVSDGEILLEMVNRLELSDVTPLTPDSIYVAYLEVKKASDAWVKYYMISVVLLVIAAARVTSDLSLFGTNISGPFIGPAAIIYFSACTLVYTNHELKMRLYRAFFKSRLAQLSGPDRAHVLLRYPLAFYGTEYQPKEARPEGFTVSWKQVRELLPAVAVLGFGWLLAVCGLMGLLGYVLYGIYAEPTLHFLIKAAVFVCFFCAVTMSATMLRSPKVRHTYER